MTALTRPAREAVEDAVRDMVRRERARVDDPGACVPGADPDDAHGWHDGSGWQHPREPGRPLFHPEAWRFFRLLDLGWLVDDLLVVFAWDELGTPDLRYVTRERFGSFQRNHPPYTQALTVRMSLRYLLAPGDGAHDPSSTASWRDRCERLWLGPDTVLVGPGLPQDQDRLDRGWELPWPSLTNPARRRDPAPDDAAGRRPRRPGWYAYTPLTTRSDDVPPAR